MKWNARCWHDTVGAGVDGWWRIVEDDGNVRLNHFLKELRWS